MLYYRKMSATIAVTVYLALIFCSCSSNARITETTPETLITTTQTTAPSPSPLPTPVPTDEFVIESPATDSSGRPYQLLSVTNPYQVDLNNDGKKESISLDFRQNPAVDWAYQCYVLFVNGEVAAVLSDEHPTVVLIDLDTADGHLDLLIEYQRHGDQYYSEIYFYDGLKLINRGTLIDSFLTWPGRNDEQPGSQPSGLIAAKFPEQGILIEYSYGEYGNRLNEYWFYEQPWIIAPNGLFESVPLDDYLPMLCLDEATGARLHYLPATLIIDLPLYADPSAAQTSITAAAGESVRLIRTDNLQWFELQRPNGQRGWFRTDYFGGYNILSNGDVIDRDDVFEGPYFE